MCDTVLVPEGHLNQTFWPIWITAITMKSEYDVKPQRTMWGSFPWTLFSLPSKCVFFIFQGKKEKEKGEKREKGEESVII